MTGVTGVVTAENIYTGDERVSATLKRAYADADAWIRPGPRANEEGDAPTLPG